MTKPYPISDELREAGFIFREEFETIDTFTKNGGTLLNGASIADGGGLVLDGADDYATIHRSLTLNGQGFVVVRFTPDFDWDENVLRGILSDSSSTFRIGKHNNANSNILFCGLNGSSFYSIGADYGAYWRANEENTLVISLNQSDNAMWLNGANLTINVRTAGSATLSSLLVGQWSGAYFDGTIHSIQIGNEPLTDEDAALFSQPGLLDNITVEQSILTLPSKQAYERTSDSKTVTPMLGRIATEGGVDEALLGSDGVTSGEFPTLIKPRGFSFDGGGLITGSDNDLLSFTNGVNDMPFSVGVYTMLDTASVGSRSVIHKASAFLSGEYHSFINASSNQCAFYLIDNSAGSRIGRITSNDAVPRGCPFALVLAYDGSKTAAGIKIYINGDRVDSANYSSGAYNGMEPTALDLSIHGLLAGVTSGLIAQSPVPAVFFDKGLSQIEARALTARMRRWSWT